MLPTSSAALQVPRLGLETPVESCGCVYLRIPCHFAHFCCTAGPLLLDGQWYVRVFSYQYSPARSSPVPRALRLRRRLPCGTVLGGIVTAGPSATGARSLPPAQICPLVVFLLFMSLVSLPLPEMPHPLGGPLSLSCPVQSGPSPGLSSPGLAAACVAHPPTRCLSFSSGPIFTACVLFSSLLLPPSPILSPPSYHRHPAPSTIFCQATVVPPSALDPAPPARQPPSIETFGLFVLFHD